MTFFLSKRTCRKKTNTWEKARSQRAGRAAFEVKLTVVAAIVVVLAKRVGGVEEATCPGGRGADSAAESPGGNA